MASSSSSLQDKIDDLEARFKKAESEENVGNKSTEQDAASNKRTDRLPKSVNFSLASPSPRKCSRLTDSAQLSQSAPNRPKAALSSPIKPPAPHSAENTPFNLQCPKLRRPLPPSGAQRLVTPGNVTTLPSEQQAAETTSPTAVFQLETPSPGSTNEFAVKSSARVSNSASNSPSTAANTDVIISRPRSAGNLGNLPLGGQPRKKPNFHIPFAPVAKSQKSVEIENKLKEIMKLAGLLTIDGKDVETGIADMEALGELGHGTCGHVIKMVHKPTGAVMAVKQMRRSCNDDENKRIIMDLDVVMNCHSCPYIVLCLGTFITSSDVWICMEIMATCLDKLMKKLGAIPEKILGKVTVATLNALNYLKESHGVIHRDVKPSNILLDERGTFKLCDFGISGRLVDSKAKTRSAGCAAYMAPERIDPPDPSQPDYDIRADVWSLGLTLVELATGEFPYKNCTTDFEVLTKVLQDEQPRLPPGRGFSMDFENLVNSCLTKDYRYRPKYPKLLMHNFVKRYSTLHVDVAGWYEEVTRRLSPPGQPRQHADDSCNILHGGTISSSSMGSCSEATVSSNTTAVFSTGALATNVLNLTQPSPVPPRKSLTTLHSPWKGSSAASSSEQQQQQQKQPNVSNVAPLHVRQLQQRNSLVLPPHSLSHLTSSSSSQSTSSSPVPFSYPDVRRFDPLCTDAFTPVSSSPLASTMEWTMFGTDVVVSSSPTGDSSTHSRSSISKTGSPFRPSGTFSSSLYMVPQQHFPGHPPSSQTSSSSSPASSSTHGQHASSVSIGHPGTSSPSYIQRRQQIVTPSSSSSSLQSDQSPNTCATPFSAPPMRSSVWSPDNSNVLQPTFFSSPSSSLPYHHQRPQQASETTRSVMTASVSITLSHPSARSSSVASASAPSPPSTMAFTQMSHASHYSPSSSATFVCPPTSPPSSAGQFLHVASSAPSSAASTTTTSPSSTSAVDKRHFSHFTKF
ncbi:hypothetical protein HELRODRAFT_191434 [Helobdella robusta]|uniref:mitogen-activated protein kinase kinase n=1 Tax=Helobdella robusta TaxID=6412 RepID=T1FSZ3_HELRO|nr:hypothetical protein HELRODRAFT_191434 [Helobdella robusta]ESO05287.1 hypothetical protein HELRODRAFT_191434 [Helobdella robusta]